jgi:hypothetical protein
MNSPKAVFRFIATTPLCIVGAAANPETRLLWWALAAGTDLIAEWLAHPMLLLS